MKNKKAYNPLQALIPNYENLMNPFVEYQRNFNRLFQNPDVLNAMPYKNISNSFEDLAKSFQTSIATLSPALENLQKLAIKSPPMDSIYEANKAIFQRLGPALSSPEFNKNFRSLDSSWKNMAKSMKSTIDTLQGSRAVVQSHFATFSKYSLIAQSHLSQIPWDSIGGLLNVSFQEIATIEKSIIDLSSGYSNLFKSLIVPEIKIGSLPPLVSGLPPIELLTHVELIDTITRNDDDRLDLPESEEILGQDIIEEIEYDFENLLFDHNPDSVTLWRGAKQSLDSGNPDRFRHSITSLRELFTHVLHKIAPDENIQLWTSEEAYYHNGKPTRRARLMFLCRKVNHDPFTDFVDKDIDATLKFLDLFHKGMHELKIDFTQTQVSFMITRMESLLRFLLKISKTEN